MAMTEEERRAARNAASKRWYAAHKAAKKAGAKQKPARKAEAKKPAKKVEAKPARAARPAKKAPGADVQKRIDKFVKKNEKTAASAAAMVKEAASILADVYKAGDQKLVEKATKLFARKLSIGVCDGGDGRMVAKLEGAKPFRVPKRAAAEASTPEPAKEPADEQAAEESAEIPVDPAMLTGVEEGTVTKADLDAQAAGSEDDEGDEDEEKDPDEEEEKDPDDMDDEELEKYRERQAEKEADAFFEGRAETMREFEEQGAYDD